MSATKERTKTITDSAMPGRNKVAFLISILAFIFLVPGLMLSMLTIQSNEAINTNIADFGFGLYHTSNSILNTIHRLYLDKREFVAGMILLFSVIVPIVKGLMLIYILLSKSTFVREKLFDFVKSIGKWSMCDVFVVATFLAYLSTRARTDSGTHEFTVMEMPIDVNVAVNTSAHLEIGFYFFLSYCLLSLIALQLYKKY